MFLLVLWVSNFFTVTAQTVLIDSVREGSFALGNSFADNGWMLHNGNNINGWAIGFPYDQRKAAFASPNWNEPNPVPGIDVSEIGGTGKSLVFYRDIDIPAGEDVIELRFLYCHKGGGTLDIGLYNENQLPSNSNSTYSQNGSAGSLFSSGMVFSINWFEVVLHLHPSNAGKKVRLVFFVGYRSPGFPILDNTSSIAISGISLISRSPKNFQSLPGSFYWRNPEAWQPQGVPAGSDNVFIPAGSTIFEGTNHINNLTIAGTLHYGPPIISGNLQVESTGRFDIGSSPGVNFYIQRQLYGHLTIQPGGYIDVRDGLLIFNRPATLEPMEQVFSFSSPSQFEEGLLFGLEVDNPQGVRIETPSANRLTVSRFLALKTGKLTTNDKLEINHQKTADLASTTFTFGHPECLSEAVFRAPGAKISLRYAGIFTIPNSFGSQDEPYVLGSAGECLQGDTLYELSISSYFSHIKVPWNINISSPLGSGFRIFNKLQMAEGTTITLTDPSYLGAAILGFPGAAGNNASNNAHISGGAIAYRIHGNNLNRVFPVGFNGQNFPFGMYGISADNALVRVSLIQSETGSSGAGISQLHPLYRYKVEVLEGSLTKVDSVVLGYNTITTGFIDGDQNNRRAVVSATADGTYTDIGGPRGGSYVVNNVFPLRPSWDFSWINATSGNYNSTAYYALALSSGSFAKMWRNTQQGGSFLWDDPNNWVGNTVPTADDIVLINAPGTTITVSAASVCKKVTIMPGTNLVVPPGINFKVGN